MSSAERKSEVAAAETDVVSAAEALLTTEWTERTFTAMVIAEAGSLVVQSSRSYRSDSHAMLLTNDIL